MYENAQILLMIIYNNVELNVEDLFGQKEKMLFSWNPFKYKEIFMKEHKVFQKKKKKGGGDLDSQLHDSQ